MDSRAKVIAFLRAHVAHHGELCPEMLLLKKGKWFDGRRSSDDYESAKAWRKHNRPRAKHCYHNAQLYACEDRTAKYFEGYALISPTMAPVHHAWIEMADGGVIDFTFEAMERKAMREKLSCDTSSTVYVGFTIPRQILVRSIAEDGETQPLAESYFVGVLMAEMLNN